MIIIDFFKRIGSDISALAKNEPSERGVRSERINALVLRIFGLLTLMAAVAAIPVVAVFMAPLAGTFVSIGIVVAGIFGWDMCVMGDNISQLALEQLNNSVMSSVELMGACAALELIHKCPYYMAETLLTKLFFRLFNPSYAKIP